MLRQEKSHLSPQVLLSVSWQQTTSTTRTPWDNAPLEQCSAPCVYFTEKGDFLALDLGGTNFRVLHVRVMDEELRVDSEICAVPQEVMLGTGEQVTRRSWREPLIDTGISLKHFWFIWRFGSFNRRENLSAVCYQPSVFPLCFCSCSNTSPTVSVISLSLVTWKEKLFLWASPSPSRVNRRRLIRFHSHKQNKHIKLNNHFNLKLILLFFGQISTLISRQQHRVWGWHQQITCFCVHKYTYSSLKYASDWCIKFTMSQHLNYTSEGAFLQTFYFLQIWLHHHWSPSFDLFMELGCCLISVYLIYYFYIIIYYCSYCILLLLANCYNCSPSTFLC